MNEIVTLVAPRRPQSRRPRSAVHPWLSIQDHASLGPHWVGYAKDRNQKLQLLHFRVPQPEDTLFEALPLAAPYNIDGLLLHFRAPPNTQWDIAQLLDQSVDLYSRLFNRKRFQWQLRPREGALLDDYLSVTSRMAFAHGGTLVHFSADRIDVLFGAPQRMEPREALNCAVLCALDMHAAVEEMGEAW